MKTAIFYHSKYGTTKQYAIWISEQIKMDIFNIHKVDKEILNEYTTIILGSDLFYSQLSIMPFIKKNKDSLKDKKIIVFICEYLDNTKLIQKQLTEIFETPIALYSIKGLIPSKLTLFDKFQFALTKRLNPHSSLLLESSTTIHKEHLNPLITYIKSTTL